MKIAKDGLRSIVRIGYDGKVHKTFRGTAADERFANEIHVLKVLENRCCDYVPRYLDSDPESLTLITTNCGQPVESLSTAKTEALFDDLEENFGVVHDDPFSRNITYHALMGRFCIIDFELAHVLDRESDQNQNDDDVSLSIDWFGESVDGKRKKGNEDCLSAFASDDGWAEELRLSGELDIAERGAVFAVSDGMGGTAGGGYASWLAVKELRQFLPARMGHFEGNAEPLKHLALAVLDLNNYVNRIGESKPDVKGMGATLVCGLFNRRDMHFAHVGDSRIYQFYEGELEQLTYDHSRVGEMERLGKISEREARCHPVRNILNQAIGTGKDKLQPQVGTIQLQSGMWFLFCSDGLIDGLWNKRIKNEFADSEENGRSPEDTAKAFLDEAIRAAGKDDTTLFVVRVK